MCRIIRQIGNDTLLYPRGKLQDNFLFCLFAPLVCTAITLVSQFPRLQVTIFICKLVQGPRTYFESGGAGGLTSDSKWGGGAESTFFSVTQ